MGRAVTLGTNGRGRRVAALFAMTLASLLPMACAGGGKDRDFRLPPGTELDDTRSGKVLVVVEAWNECGRDNTCVQAPASPCHLGQGNTRGISVYRLGTSGLFFKSAVTGAVAEQRIATDDNPRRVVVHPKDPTLLYVATQQRVQVIRLRSEGGSACIDETASDQEIDPDSAFTSPVDMVIDPSFGNGILYVAEQNADRVDAYSIADDGTLPDIPSSCIVGSGSAEYTAVTPLSEGFFAAGGEQDIEIHIRVQGQFIPPPVFNATPTPTPAPTQTPSPAPGETPQPSIPAPAPTCIGANTVSIPVSAIGAALVTDLIFAPSASAPLGELFVTEQAGQRIFTFPVDADGLLDGEDSSSTDPVGIYQRMLPHVHGGSSLLYASLFDQGRVDVFQLVSGVLPKKNFSRTAEDPDSLPVGLAIDEPSGTILYVSQGGYSRVDGFRIQTDGGLPDIPATSTAPPVNAVGQDLETFPDDIAIVPLP